jgi:hypothetical protein
MPSPVRGKGHVVRDIFRKIDADWIIMVDGDATYDASAAPLLLRTAMSQEIDMLVGKRCTPAEESSRAYRPMHQLGNRMVCGLIRSTFRVPLHDVFSGYRVFSRVFAKTIPLHSGGFEVETELTLQAISKNFTVMELETQYKARPPRKLFQTQHLPGWHAGFELFFGHLSILSPHALFRCLRSVVGGAQPAGRHPADFGLSELSLGLPGSFGYFGDRLGNALSSQPSHRPHLGNPAQIS